MILICHFTWKFIFLNSWVSFFLYLTKKVFSCSCGQTQYLHEHLREINRSLQQVVKRKNCHMLPAYYKIEDRWAGWNQPNLIRNMTQVTAMTHQRGLMSWVYDHCKIRSGFPNSCALSRRLKHLLSRGAHWVLSKQNKAKIPIHWILCKLWNNQIEIVRQCNCNGVAWCKN